MITKSNRSMDPTDPSIVEGDSPQSRLVKQNLEHIAAILDRLNEAVIQVDRKGRITGWSRGAQQIYGYSPVEATGQEITILLLPDSAAKPAALLRQAVRGRKLSQVEITNVCKDGRLIDVSVMASPLYDPDGERVGVAFVIRDISERKSRECQLKKSNEELRQRLEERNRELARTNAELRQEIQERRRAYLSEKRARRNAEILRTASLALSSTLDLATAAQTLLEYGDRLVHFDGANISLIEHSYSMEIIAVKYRKPLEEIQNFAHTFVDTSEYDYLGKVLEARKSVWITDTRDHPGWRHYAGQPAVLSWLGVPLMSMERVIGIFALEKGEAGYFNYEQVRLIEGLAAQVSVTIQNAWLFDQVRAGRQRLQALSRKLVEIQETERKYVARELHDETSQALTSLMVGLRMLEKDAENPGNIHSGVAELQLMLQSVVENLHRLAMDLRPASLDHLGLVAALRQYIDAMSDKHGLTIRFEVANINTRLPPDLATAVYRIVQEALTNIVRHARATQVDVILEQREGQIVAVIEDNGVGFDPRQAMRGERLGLFGMRERAEMFGGKLIVESVAEIGTTIVVEVPYGHSDTRRR